MKRKIIQHGSSCSVTLPNKWVRAYSLKKGDEINVEIQNNCLILNAEKTNIKRVKIDIRGWHSTLIRHFLHQAYRSGYEEIEVHFDNFDRIKNTSTNIIYAQKPFFLPLEIIQQIVNLSIGLEIVEHGKDFCIIKELAETKDIEFDTALSRLFLLVNSLGEDSLESARKKDLISLKNTFIIGENITKISDFCIRILNKKGYKEIEKTMALQKIVSNLRFIADSYKNINYYILKYKEKIDNETIVLYQGVNAILKDFCHIFYKSNPEEIRKFHMEYRKIILMVNKAKKKSSILSYLKEILDVIDLIMDGKIELELISSNLNS